jgi:hypothetical protein
VGKTIAKIRELVSGLKAALAQTKRARFFECLGLIDYRVAK